MYYMSLKTEPINLWRAAWNNLLFRIGRKLEKAHTIMKNVSWLPFSNPQLLIFIYKSSTFMLLHGIV
jgi:hypothetical protein